MKSMADTLRHNARTAGHLGQIERDLLFDAADEVERLEKLVFVPGMMRCAKCKFVGMHMVLRASDGAVGVKADLEPEKCPNGCGPLWRVSERDSGNEVCDRLEKYILRERALEAALQEIADLDKFGGYNTACDRARKALKVAATPDAN